MKPISLIELVNVVDSSKVLVGARLQEIITANDLLMLGFWSSNRMLWLCVDLNTNAPLLLPFSELSFSVKNKKTPLNLFLRAHFVGKAMQSIEVMERVGRVVSLNFGANVNLQLRLFPHGENVIAEAGDKKISMHIVQNLVAQEKSHESLFRDLNVLREQWLSGRERPRSKSESKVKSDALGSTIIGKREKALAKVRAELLKKQQLPWREIGEWIVAKQSLAVPAEWQAFVDKRRKLAWNVEQCFSRAKENERKIEGTELRARKLQMEISALQERERSGIPLASDTPLINPLKAIAAEGRSLRLSPEISVIAGKSAADNMKLLRKARSWDYWIHLKDLPSSHAIVFRNKKSDLSQEDWQAVAQWFLRMTFSSRAKAEKMQGEKFELLIVECRFVTAIKGDRLGRVNFRNERVLGVRFQA